MFLMKDKKKQKMRFHFFSFFQHVFIAGAVAADPDIDIYWALGPSHPSGCVWTQGFQPPPRDASNCSYFSFFHFVFRISFSKRKNKRNRKTNHRQRSVQCCKQDDGPVLYYTGAFTCTIIQSPFHDGITQDHGEPSRRWTTRKS